MSALSLATRGMICPCPHAVGGTVDGKGKTIIQYQEKPLPIVKLKRFTEGDNNFDIFIINIRDRDL